MLSITAGLQLGFWPPSVQCSLYTLTHWCSIYLCFPFLAFKYTHTDRHTIKGYLSAKYYYSAEVSVMTCICMYIVVVPLVVYKVIMDDWNGRELQQLSLSLRPPTCLFYTLHLSVCVAVVNQWVLVPGLQWLQCDSEPLAAHRWVHKSSRLCLHSWLQPLHSAQPQHPTTTSVSNRQIFVSILVDLCYFVKVYNVMAGLTVSSSDNWSMALTYNTLKCIKMHNKPIWWVGILQRCLWKAYCILKASLGLLLTPSLG